MPTRRRPPSAERLLFGRRLRAERHAKGLTLEDVAESADMNWSYVAQVERGTRNVSIDNMAALAKATDVSLASLLQPDDEYAEEREGG